MSELKTCLVCGKKYKFCNHCRPVPFEELWRLTYCSEDCRKIFNICCRYAGKDISADEAYKILIQCNVEGKEIQMSVKNSVEKIIKEAEKSEPKSEVTRNADEVTEVSERPRRRPRRRRNKNEE